MKSEEITALYNIIRRFLTLNHLVRFDIGSRMHLIQPEDSYLPQPQIDEKIIEGMYNKKRVEEFVKLIYDERYK